MKELELKELAEIAIRRDSWKHRKLWVWAHDYGYKADEWNNIVPPVKDDRRIFICTYWQIFEAIESLSDNPPSVVTVAMNRYIQEERKMMDDIIRRFGNIASVINDSIDNKGARK